jgi:hypothetical protein
VFLISYIVRYRRRQRISMATSLENRDGEKQVSGSSEIQEEKPNVQTAEYAPASRIDEEFQWSIGKFIAVTVSPPPYFAMMN